jgi:hypothetical protein
LEEEGKPVTDVTIFYASRSEPILFAGQRMEAAIRQGLSTPANFEHRPRGSDVREFAPEAVSRSSTAADSDDAFA